MTTANDTPQGRLELTWANKTRRLIARDDGAYEWVSPKDYRVREVRLLREAGTVGQVASDREREPLDNLLIRGDSLHALNSLTGIPAYADELLGKVKLIYIDPPFNTGEAFSQYDDGLEHSVWLTMMRDRFVQMKRLLAPDGSIWVHLDDNEMAYCRVLMDEVFGRDNFVATVVWQKVYARDNRTSISTSQDYLIVFAASPTIWRTARNLLDRGEAGTKDYKNPDDDPRGPWKAGDFTAQAGRGTPTQFYTLRSPGGREFDPPAGRCWLYTQDRYEDLVADGRVWFGADGSGRPALKRFLSEVQQGLVPMSWWPHEEVGHNQEGKKEILALFPSGTPFATPKPERLMERVIHIATNPGDIVLDCFAGSGTTAAVAHKMGRRWVTVEWEKETLETFIAPRLAKVVAGEDPGGITEVVGWEGGGGFRVLDVAPSMYEDDGGVVVLADWAAQHELAEAVAAQLGFDYDEQPPFCGRRGRTRLAVIDGLVTTDTVRLLVGALGDGETLSLVGVGLDPDADALVRRLRPGSRARVAPRDLLLTYASPAGWSVSTTPAPIVAEDAEEGEA